MGVRIADSLAVLVDGVGQQLELPKLERCGRVGERIVQDDGRRGEWRLAG